MTHHTAEEDTGEAEITASQPRVLRGPVEPSLKATYPDVRTSRLLRYRKLLFVFINRYFGVVPAVLYLMTVWMVSATVVHPDPDSLADVLAITGCAWHRNPSLTLWAFFVTAVLVIFTDTHSRLYRWLGGLAHGAATWPACSASAGGRCSSPGGSSPAGRPSGSAWSPCSWPPEAGFSVRC